MSEDERCSHIGFMLSNLITDATARSIDMRREYQQASDAYVGIRKEVEKTAVELTDLQEGLKCLWGYIASDSPEGMSLKQLDVIEHIAVCLHEATLRVAAEARRAKEQLSTNEKSHATNQSKRETTVN